MKRLPFVSLGCVVLVFLGCDRMLNRGHKVVYVPSEEGLTLVYEDYENPSQTPEQRLQDRLQRRVSATKETPQGKRVTITYTTLRSNQSFDFQTKDGSWTMMQDETPVFNLLPEGFPDSGDRWEDREKDAKGQLRTVRSFRIIGRAALENSSLQLPDDFNRIGIWVEMESLNGPKLRIFFLPNIGEEESLMLKDGKWVLVDRLVSRGFTDAPITKTEAKKP